MLTKVTSRPREKERERKRPEWLWLTIRGPNISPDMKDARQAEVQLVSRTHDNGEVTGSCGLPDGAYEPQEERGSAPNSPTGSTDTANALA
ncbi:hypothetical protein SAMN05428963_103391 [Consotaella salsifontis]|uniref:Uncharacterized protein n=1 Tax=Consotaella salsifontis TaxID=1365950 RepID=A0A1T4P999_9HYPH|nr:hypothetical protein SAMN05428963_103391 [Consotaella salsifontis]